MNNRKKFIRKYGFWSFCIIAVIICCLVFGFFFSPAFSHISGVKKNIYWCDLTDGAAQGTIEIDFKQENGTVYTKKIKSNETSYIKVKEPVKICRTSREGSYNIKIHPEYKINDYDSFEIFLFPLCEIKEQEYSYLVRENLENRVIAYFIEAWDEKQGENYYIFSKDNIIEKPEVIFKTENIENLGTKFEKNDIAFYNGHEQELAKPYNGYVVKSKVDGQFVMLSTLWDE